MSQESSRKSMLQGQIFTNRVNNPEILDALNTIPREIFVPEKYKKVAYIDEDLPLGHGRVLLQPLIFARMLQLAEIQKNHRVLDIACGSGYSSAVISLLAKEVISLESESEFTANANANFAKLGIKNARPVASDLLTGAPEYKPYDVIIIEGTVEHVPDAILKQLRVGGRLVTVLANGNVGNIIVINKTEKLVSQATHHQAMSHKLEEFKLEAGFKF